MKIIDPHLHLFDLKKGDYSWLRPENPPFFEDKHAIARNFSEYDLTLTSPLTLVGFVHIEAGFDNQQPWREIAWLESSCQMPFRSIAMLDITLPKLPFLRQLNKLMRYQSVVGIRYILDDDALVILSNKNSQNNLAILAEKKLIFELQMPLADSQAVDSLIKVLSVTPDLKLCINHAGWPTKNNQQQAIWLHNLQRLASFTDVFIKCSGFEIADRDYSANWADKVIRQCIQSFGIDRVMLASNFPLCLWHANYQETWLGNTLFISTELTKTAPEFAYNTEQLQQLCFSNAHRFYKFL
ncbi:amidohydrolase family protein [Colwellia sp. C1TZA3]|uniref:amidohydrolase family protein n=1 Tax=Colwellia sp. C1TZA3 TaxID=2508879 RepID=UPI0011B9E127|nr:amidohydrolase family protein [Colwellia sp. C1TZA3]TWX68468.1 amidohydrolase family protein [Colwellia sp. C1TZA3]